MDGWMDGWIDRWMDRWMDGWIDRYLALRRRPSEKRRWGGELVR